MKFRTLGVVVALLMAGACFAGDLKLPAIISDHMVLQRDKDVPIWGWAKPGQEVVVTFAGQTAKTVATDAGKWLAKLSPMAASAEARDMEVKSAGGESLTVKNVLVGEVWIGSGQSNMAMTLGGTDGGREAAAAANHPNVRLLRLPLVLNRSPQPDVVAQWSVCEAGTATVSGFSSVLFHFGTRLHAELGIPVGLIHTAWGGTRIEPWTPPEGFASVDSLKKLSESVQNADSDFEKAKVEAINPFAQWLDTARQAAEAGTIIPDPPAWPRHAISTNQSPTALYNAMVHPLVPFAIRGVVWYQGESNRGDGMAYADKMKALIQGWRAVWNQGDFPFYFVQLAPYTYGGSVTALPEMWEAQTASMAIPNTGMAVIVDIGNLRDIHPRNKRDVGHRLALWALAKDYGKDIVHSGPLYKGHVVEADAIRIQFDHVGGGLKSRDGKPLTWFTIAGEDKNFVNAEATIDGQTIVVRSDKVAAPVAVRFGWHQLAEPNLCNASDLPASPFRTDKW